MDKLMDKPWFIKLLSLALALLLYSAVPHTTSKFIGVNVPGEQTTATITDIPVRVYYDTENLVVSGIPSTVEMTIKGPITHVQSAKALRNFEVYVDLTNAKIGNQRVQLKVKNLSDKLTAIINPSSVVANVQEKITREFKVDPEFNNALIEDGYTAGQPIVEPNNVKITGAKDVVDRISFVKATIDARSNLNQTLTRVAPVLVLDKDLNKLNVSVDPEYVKVTIPIKNTSKTVPINIVQKGTPPSGVTIDSIVLDTKEATILGPEDILKGTDSVRVEVDTSKITDNTTITLPVIISNGITGVTPELVKATVTVSKTNQKTVSSIPIKIKGLPSTYTAVIDDPANEFVNLVVNGPNGVINALNPNDFNAFIDLTNYTAGNYDVNIQVTGPTGVNWKLDKTTAKITINNA